MQVNETMNASKDNEKEVEKITLNAKEKNLSSILEYQTKKYVDLKFFEFQEQLADPLQLERLPKNLTFNHL